MTQRISFASFLEKFPVISLPIVLNDEVHHEFSRHNDPLQAAMIEQFILPIEENDVDEFTEFIACFKLPDTGEFHAIVYWKAMLLNYQYVLATFTKTGLLVDRCILAGASSDGQSLTNAVATIEEDWNIRIAGGHQPNAEDPLYNASASTIREMELLPDGKIVEI